MSAFDTETVGCVSLLRKFVPVSSVPGNVESGETVNHVTGMIILCTKGMTQFCVHRVRWEKIFWGEKMTVASKFFEKRLW